MTVKDRKGKKTQALYGMQDKLLLSVLLLIIGLRGNNLPSQKGSERNRRDLQMSSLLWHTSGRNRKAGFYKERTKYIEIVINYFY